MRLTCPGEWKRNPTPRGFGGCSSTRAAHKRDGLDADPRLARGFANGQAFHQLTRLATARPRVAISIARRIQSR